MLDVGRWIFGVGFLHLPRCEFRVRASTLPRFNAPTLETFDPRGDDAAGPRRADPCSGDPPAIPRTTATLHPPSDICATILPAVILPPDSLCGRRRKDAGFSPGALASVRSPRAPAAQAGPCRPFQPGR